MEDKDSQLPRLETFHLSIEERRSEKLIPKYPSLLRYSDVRVGKAFELRIGPSSSKSSSIPQGRARTIQTSIIDGGNRFMLQPLSDSPLPDIPPDLRIHADHAVPLYEGKSINAKHIPRILS